MKRELLTSSFIDECWHAHYPSATHTLCGRPTPTEYRPGRRWAPTCRTCRRLARVFEAIDFSTPRWWFDMSPHQREKLRAGSAA